MPSYAYELLESRINNLNFKEVTKEEIASIFDDMDGELECGNITGEEFNILSSKIIIRVLLNK